MKPSIVAALPLLLVGSGCGEGAGAGDDKFRITSIAFDNDSTITLTFSRSVADVGDVDPNDFRVSALNAYDGGDYNTYTIYVDPSGLIDYDNPDFPFTFMSIESGSSDNQLILRTTTPLGPTVCDEVAEMLDHHEVRDADTPGDAKYTVGMFLHYAAGESPIESEGGMVLGNIAPDWVLNETEIYVHSDDYDLTVVDPKMRIPCP